MFSCRYADLYLVLCQLGEDPPLEDCELLPGAGVALADDGDDVDLVVQPPHELHIHTTQQTYFSVQSLIYWSI